MSRPKPLLPVVHRPMLERSIAGLARAGVDEVVLALGFRPDTFEQAFPSGEVDGVRLRYAIEPEPMDTAGAVQFAASEAGVAERFLVLNGDVLTDLDLGALIDLHGRSGGKATIHLTEVDDPSRFGVVPIDDRNRVEAFVEKPPAESAPSRWINAGTYVFEPEALATIPAGRPVSMEHEIFPALVEAGQLYALQDDSYWIDAGTPQAFLEASLDLIDGTRATEMAIHPTAIIHETASVRRSVVSCDASVSAGATVDSSVVLDGAQIGPGATVRDSIIGPRGRIGASAALSQLCVTGDDMQIAEGAVHVGERLPDQ
jgi:mannose-1-phosphate guanylyltransferase